MIDIEKLARHLQQLMSKDLKEAAVSELKGAAVSSHKPAKEVIYTLRGCTDKTSITFPQSLATGGVAARKIQGDKK